MTYGICPPSLIPDGPGFVKIAPVTIYHNMLISWQETEGRPRSSHAVGAGATPSVQSLKTIESSNASKEASTILGETPTVNQRRPLLRSRLSPNIVDASFEALLDSIIFKLWTDGVAPAPAA